MRGPNDDAQQIPEYPALFSKQPFKLYLINTGYQAVCYLAMGAILGGWR